MHHKSKLKSSASPAALAHNLAAPADNPSGIERSSFTLEEFRLRHNLSQTALFKLLRTGRGPRLMLIGSIGKRVSRQSETDWIRDREREAEAVKQSAPVEPGSSTAP
jgi:hypothetical protein